MYASVSIPQAVYNEMVGVNKVVFGAVEVQTLSWVQIQAVIHSQQVTALQEKHGNIDLGEAQAIILSKELKPPKSGSGGL